MNGHGTCSMFRFLNLGVLCVAISMGWHGTCRILSPAGFGINDDSCSTIVSSLRDWMAVIPNSQFLIL